MLSTDRLKGIIKAAFEEEQNEEQDYNGSLDRISQKLADGIIEEIKQVKITYTAGLVAPNGAVTGVMEYIIT